MNINYTNIYDYLLSEISKDIDIITYTRMYNKILNEVDISPEDHLTNFEMYSLIDKIVYEKIYIELGLEREDIINELIN